MTVRGNMCRGFKSLPLRQSLYFFYLEKYSVIFKRNKNTKQQKVKKFKYTILIGDFNIAPENIDVHDPIAWDGMITCSKQERDALTKILDLGFTDTYRHLNQNKQNFSWWDYRAGSFRRNNGLRIDLLLASDKLIKQCINSLIDDGPRKLNRPSAHAPIYAEFTIQY